MLYAQVSVLSTVFVLSGGVIRYVSIGQCVLVSCTYNDPGYCQPCLRQANRTIRTMKNI